MAMRPEQRQYERDQEPGGFYERARQRLRRALAESPSENEIRELHRDAVEAFREREPRSRQYGAYGPPSVYYEDDRQRLRRALAESPSPEEIRRHREEAIAAFERYGRRR